LNFLTKSIPSYKNIFTLLIFKDDYLNLDIVILCACYPFYNYVSSLWIDK